ncbi:HEPN domain-containing protein [Halorussus salinus]|uniref:HEPN domain-containing protein n=1 Tax=Halorussus salinus TaxID=1364935 RepID=UPI001092DA60|nr:HEPN domain-containing protein [Halorussus salinus]
MSNPYGVRIPLRLAPDFQLPNVQTSNLTIRKVTGSGDSDSDPDYEILAEFSANTDEVDEKKQEMYKEATNLGELFSFVSGKGVVTGPPHKPYRQDKTVQVTATGGTFNYPKAWAEFIVDLYENFKATDFDESTKNAMRWYSSGLSRENPTDRFLSFWLALEILSDKYNVGDPTVSKNLKREAKRAIKEARSAIQSELTQDAADIISEEVERFVKRDLLNEPGVRDDEIETAREAVVDNISSTAMKGKISTFLANELGSHNEDHGDIVDAIVELLRNTLGRGHPEVTEDLPKEIGTLYGSRNGLVHEGTPIENVHQKADQLEEFVCLVLKRRLDPVFIGEYDSSYFPESEFFYFDENLVQVLLHDEQRVLTENELFQRILAAKRVLRSNRRIGYLIADVMNADHLGIEVEESNGTKTFEYIGTNQSFECPVCGEMFDGTFFLARHLVKTDSILSTSLNRNRGVGNHAKWLLENDLPVDHIGLKETYDWVDRNREELKQ